MRRLPLGLISAPAWVARLLLPVALVLAMPAESETLQEQTDALRDSEAPYIADVPLFSGRLLAEFYAERDHQNAWDDARARAMLTLARSSRADGFEPEDFHADSIAKVLDADQLGADSEAQRTAADILLSDALLRYVHHFRFGKYNPRFINSGQNFVDKADAESLKADMARVLAAPDLAAEVTALLPDAPFYRNLKLGYQRYLAIADRGGWSDIPAGGNLTIGSKDARVPLIREHLEVIDGYKPATTADPERYDEALAEAIKGFQRRSGLAADGVVGPATLRALNQPLDDRLLAIRANLERMRWLYNDLPADYLLVDITAFRLHLMRNHQEVWTTPVVVGTTDAQTPMFRDELEHIVFNPTWSVPVSIQKKMGGVSSRYQVVDRRTGRKVSGVNASNYKRYRIVQPAGPSNALGRVKFMFPNGHAIYLHDTPSRHLFSRSERAYSHGCIRVKDPLTLAQQVLNKPNWDEGAINRVVQRGKTRYVHLDDHLPVLLYYLTAVADDQGRVGFRRDVYNRDKPLFAALDRPADRDRIAFREPEPERAPDQAPDQKPETVPETVSESSPELPAQLEPQRQSPTDVLSERNTNPGLDALAPPEASAAIQNPSAQAPEPAANLSGPTASNVTPPVSIAAAGGQTSAAPDLPGSMTEQSGSDSAGAQSNTVSPVLRLDSAGQFFSPSASALDWSLDLTPALPQALSANLEASGDTGANAAALLLRGEVGLTGSASQRPAAPSVLP